MPICAICKIFTPAEGSSLSLDTDASGQSGASECR